MEAEVDLEIVEDDDHASLALGLQSGHILQEDIGIVGSFQDLEVNQSSI